MSIELKVPSLGESINEVFIAKWLKTPGEWVEADEPVVELESDKATVELPAPAAGMIGAIIKDAGETANVGEVIGSLDETAEKGSAPAPAAPVEKKEEPQPVKAKEKPAEKTKAAKTVKPAARQPKPAPAMPVSQAEAFTEPPQSSEPEPVKSEPVTPGMAIRVMPAAQRMLEELGIEASEVPATGPGGRVLKEDVERFIAARRRAENARRATPPPPASDRNDRVVPMTPMRRTIAERLVQAQRNAALLTTFNEVDMSAVIKMRKRYADAFLERYGLKLGFMSFFVKGVIEGLKLYPQVNAEIRGNEIVYHDYYDVGIAIGGAGKGLVVPILRNSDRLTFAEIEQSIADFGLRAKENKITIEELRGGTFTISNGGVYGSMLSTPIVNPPQSAILGMHKIEERAMVVDGQIVARPMMYLALTYDHRIIDGREAVLFLRRVKECIEDPARMLMEI